MPNPNILLRRIIFTAQMKCLHLSGVSWDKTWSFLRENAHVSGLI